VLVRGGFELGDTSVATDMIDVSPSMFDGAAVGDTADGAPRSAGPEIDAVLFRGMAVREVGGKEGKGGRDCGKASAAKQC
jgi:hypothetical protein